MKTLLVVVLMENMGMLLKENSQLILAVITAIGAIGGYMMTRRDALSWRRTEFICAQLRYLGADSDLTEMLKILEGRHPLVTISQVFDVNSVLNKEEQNNYQQRFDKFLDFLWVFCFAYLNLKTLSDREIASIGRYLWQTVQYPVLVEYCKDHGYGRVITVASRLGYSLQPVPIQQPPT